MKKRILAMLLVFSMLCSVVLAGCANDSDDAGKESESNAAIDTPAESDSESVLAEAEPEQITYTANVPEMDMDGRTFTFLTTNWQQNGYQRHEIWAEDYTGEAINDAVYERNTTIMDRFDCVVAVNPCYFTNESAKLFQQTVQADDGAYQFLVQRLNQFQNSVAGGFYANLDAIPYLDFSQPWWDQNSYEQLSLANHHFVVCSDITILDKDFTNVIMFNKAIADELQLGNLYDMVNNGTWTLDKTAEFSAKAYSDLNGDSNIDKDDRFGMIGQRNTLLACLNGGGLYLATKNEEDIPVHTLGSEEVLTALERVADLMYDEKMFLNAHIDLLPLTSMFMNGQSLFLQTTFEWVDYLRAMDDDFGILPMPKLSEAQEGYHCNVDSWTGACFGVAVNAVGVDKTADEQMGTFLESYACEGRNLIYPAYYDALLQGKVARDNDSQAMLDLIFDNRVYDPGAIGNWNSFAENLIYMTMTFNRSFASSAQTSQKVVTKRIGAIIEKIAENYPEA